MHPEPCSSTHSCALSSHACTHTHTHLHVCTHSVPYTPPRSHPFQGTHAFPHPCRCLFAGCVLVRFSVERGAWPACQPHQLRSSMHIGTAWRARVASRSPGRGCGQKEGGFPALSLDGEKMFAGRQEVLWQPGSKPGHPSSCRRIALTCHGTTRDDLCCPHCHRWRQLWQPGVPRPHLMPRSCPCPRLADLIGELRPLRCSSPGSHSPSPCDLISSAS